jgi:RNA polymerase sigma factor (sigma-70 family)
MDMTNVSAVAVVDNAITGYSNYSQTRLSVHEVIRRHHYQLLAWLGKRLSIPDDAYDVAQESYIKLLKYEGSADIRSAWAVLQKIAINVARDLGRTRRSRSNELHCSIDDVELESMAPSIERVLEAEQELKIVMRAITGLPTRCRQVFLLSRIDGMTYTEIAEHCEISVKMVEKHISHALMVCTQSLRHYRQ